MKITDEQWKHLLELAKMGYVAEPAIKAASDFSKSIEQLQASAGQSSEQLSELQGALLDMATQEDLR